MNIVVDIRKHYRELFFFSRDEIRRVAVHNVFLGFILLVCSHTFLLHCWSNCWAKLLGFADCTFYEVPTILIQ